MLGKPMLKAFLGGLIGSLVMLALFWVLPMLGAPRFNLFGLLSTVVEDVKWAAPVEYIILGAILFPLIYAKLLFNHLPGPPWVQGLIWGVILWVFRGVIVMPIMGQGFFAVHMAHSLAIVFETLVGNAIYGVILGAVAGEMSTERTKIPKEMYAERR